MQIILLLASLASQAGPIDRWGGFKEGSWVKARIVHEMDGKKQELETTRTVKEVKDDQVVLTLANNPGLKGAILRMRRDLLSTIGSTECVIVGKKDLEAEEIAVGAKTLKCAVHEIQWKLNKDAKIVETLKLWETETVPGRVVKAEGVFHDFGMKEGKGWKFSSRLTSLDEKMKVGARELACAVFESTASGPGPWTDKVWIHAEVPGSIVRSLGQREVDGKKERTEWTVLDFETKK